MKISDKSNGRILEKWLKFSLSHSDQNNRLLNFTPAFFCRFKDLEPMLQARCIPSFSFQKEKSDLLYGIFLKKCFLIVMASSVSKTNKNQIKNSE